MKTLSMVFAATAALILVSHSAMAAVPDMVPVQGVLADSIGAPVDTLTDMTFTLYDGETSTTVLWTEDYTDVDVDEGFFTVYLGENSSNALEFDTFLTNSEIWLGITVGTDPEMDRILLASVPFAQEALVCGSVGSLTESDINSNFVSSTSPSAGITANQVSNWDAAYGWGDHSGLYAPSAHVHSWSDITSGMPSGFADGVDDDTTYAAGSGLTLSGNTFSIGTSAITATHLATNSVTAVELAYNSVGAAELMSNSVAASEIATGAVGTSEIANGSVHLDDLNTATIFEPSLSTYSETYNTINYTASSGGEILLSQSMTVPDAGTVLVVADASYRCNNCSATDTYASMLAALTTSAASSITDSTAQPTEVYSSYNASYAPRGNLSINRVFSVTAGTTTFYLRAGSHVGTADTRVGYRHMSLIYIPD